MINQYTMRIVFFFSRFVFSLSGTQAESKRKLL